MKLKVVLLLLLVAMLVLTGCSPASQTSAEEPVEELEQAADTVSTATLTKVTDETALLEGFSANGGWIILFEGDISTEKELDLAKGPTNDGVPSRKVALYNQDADKNVTARYTLTAPSITVKSVNSRIHGGTFVGDVYVTAEGFRLVDAVVDGNIYFSSQGLLDAFDATEGEVTGIRAVGIRCH